MPTIVKNTLAAALFLVGTAAAGPGLAGNMASGLSAPSVVAAEPVRIPVTTDGLVGDLYLPDGGAARHPAVLVLGGSEGGLKGSTYEARALAKRGYVAFALAYFGAPGVPDQLVNIPLEYFGSALKFLGSQKGVDAGRIGVMGTSKGGEAALLIATKFHEIRVVVAGVPSSVIWQGIDMKDRTDPAGSWTQGGKPVPFVPYDMSRPFTSVHDLYVRSLATSTEHPDAVIPVERINGPVMLICGESDTLWPSCPMSEAVALRLKARGFRAEVETLRYLNAGHAAFGIPIPDGNLAKAMLLALGGDAEGNNAARADSWGNALAFLDRALKP